MQQDAHEFLNFLINHINEIILGKSLNNIKIISFFLINTFLIKSPITCTYLRHAIGCKLLCYLNSGEQW